jgi:type VI secretion system protein ImpK
MDPDDPFFKSTSADRTVIKPVPGGRHAVIRRASNTPSGVSAMSGGPLPRLGKLNPLESAASGLLALMTRLKICFVKSFLLSPPVRKVNSDNGLRAFKA